MKIYLLALNSVAMTSMMKIEKLKTEEKNLCLQIGWHKKKNLRGVINFLNFS